MSNLSNTYTDDNNTDYSKLILKAFSDRKPEIAAFIVDQTKQKINFDKLDRYGRNIIHYLVIFYGYESLRKLLNSIIQNSSETKLKTVLNVQDKLGNAPLHYAIMFNLNELTSILINKGANPKLKNKDGNSIITDKDCEDEDEDEDDDELDEVDEDVNKKNKYDNNNRDDEYEICNNGDSQNNSATPKLKSFVILMKPSSQDLTSISNINSVSNLDDLSMSNNMSSDVFIRKNKDSLENSSIGINETDGKRNNLSAQEINTALEKIVRAFSQPSQISQLSNDSETFKFDRNGLLTDTNTNTNSISALKNIKSDMRNMRNTNDDIDTDNFAMAILDKLKSSKPKRQSHSQTQTHSQTQSQSQTNDNDDVPEDSWRVKQIPELVVGPRSGEPYVLSMNSMNNDPTTDMMINKLRNPQYKSQLVGGKKNKKNKVSGKRKIHTFSELSYGISKHKNLISENSLGEPIVTDDDFKEANNKITAELFEDNKKNSKKSEDSDDKEDDDKFDKKLTSELSEMARNIARQSSDIHERTIEKIASILKLDLKNPEDNKTVRYYKAAIWRLVKEEHPELSNYDRSVEMEKNITEEKLKSIDIEKVSKEIDKYFSEKSDIPKPKSTKPTLPISSESLTSDKPKKEKKEKKEEKPKKDSKKETKKESKKKLKRMENSNETLSISTET